jgi:hypothetical protein
MKTLILILKILFWLWIFIVPTSIMSFIAFLVFHSINHLIIPFLFIPAGMLAGVTAAEHVRKKYGLEYFFGGLLSTPELRRENENDVEE